MALALLYSHQNNKNEGYYNFNGTTYSQSGYSEDFLEVMPSASMLYFIVPNVAVGPTLAIHLPLDSRSDYGTYPLNAVLSARLSAYF